MTIPKLSKKALIGCEARISLMGRARGVPRELAEHLVEEGGDS